jgi:hypothetical protein
MNGSSETYCEEFVGTTTPGLDRRRPHAVLFGDIAEKAGIVGKESEVSKTQTSRDEATDDTENECELPAFPEWVISGAAGEFARLYSSSLESPIEFFYMSFLTCLGSVCADRLTLATALYPQPRLYVVLLGESADERKSTAIAKASDLFKEFFSSNISESLRNYGYYFRESYGVGSAEGLQNVLDETNKVLLCIDELKAFIGKCKAPGSVLLPAVNTLFERNESENRTKTTNIVLHDVYLSFLAASTVKTYEEVWDSTFTNIGLPNRLFLVPGKGQRRFSIPGEISMDKKTEIMLLLSGVLHLVEQVRVLPITESAYAKYDQWYMNREQSVHSRRLDTYALRLASLLAVNDYKTEVDEETIDKVLALVNWQYPVRMLYDPIDADGKVARLEEKIRRNLKTRGPLSERDVRRFTNADKDGLWAFQIAVQNLRRAGDVYLDDKKKWKLTDEACGKTS